MLVVQGYRKVSIPVSHRANDFSSERAASRVKPENVVKLLFIVKIYLGQTFVSKAVLDFAVALVGSIGDFEQLLNSFIVKRY